MQKHASAGAGVAEADDLSLPPSASAEILRAEALRKLFQTGGQEIAPVDGISLSVQQGEMIAIVGPSGAGKSTFLHLLAALDTPTSGDVYFAGDSLRSLSEAALADYRNHSVGFVWQRHHLLPDFSAAENVAMPLFISGMGRNEALKVAEEWLVEVGLGARATQPAGQLSGGEQQRVAIARSLVNHPVLLLADEPTGDLDERNAESIFELMHHLHASHHLTSIIATHNLSLARRTDRVFVLERGKLAACEEPFAEAATHSQSASIGAKAPGERVTRV